MKTRIRSGVLVGCCILTLSKADAQVTTFSAPLATERYVYGLGAESPLTILGRHHENADWPRLQAYGLELLATVARDVPALGQHLGRTDENYYNVVWVADGPDGKPKVFRVLVHNGLLPERADTLPGLDNDGSPFLRDVFISSNRDARLRSAYVSTEVADPLLSQIPDVLQRWNILDFWASALGAAADQPPAVWISVNRIEFPFERATIEIADTAVTPTSFDAFKANLEKQHAALKLRQARWSSCALKLNEELRAGILEVLQSHDCQNGTAKCTAELRAKVDEVYSSTIASCAEQSAPGVGYDPAIEVEQQYRNLAATRGGSVVKGQSKLKNTPNTKLSFGLLTSVLIGSPTFKNDERRVKVDGGKIADDPLGRTMTSVILNVQPWGYDGALVRMSRRERHRFFVGGVITPDFGINAGVGFGFVRGLAVNFGGALLFVDTPRSGETVGEAPLSPNDPFKTGVAAAGFFGLSYTFK